MTGALAHLRLKNKNKNKLHSLAISYWDNKVMDGYREANKSLQSVQRNFEITYFGNQRDIHTNDLGKSWKVLRLMIGKDYNTCKNNIVVLLIIIMMLIIFNQDISNRIIADYVFQFVNNFLIFSCDIDH